MMKKIIALTGTMMMLTGAPVMAEQVTNVEILDSMGQTISVVNANQDLILRLTAVKDHGLPPFNISSEIKINGNLLTNFHTEIAGTTPDSMTLSYRYRVDPSQTTPGQFELCGFADTPGHQKVCATLPFSGAN